jgi:hypothetical protein
MDELDAASSMGISDLHTTFNGLSFIHNIFPPD